ncbi:phage late control D family protein [Nakamurella sp.]|uniref:phage late control D family protein n=1 Tax=Nakamurella sp. TaxID=1869182 RepID=UPI003B3AB1D7
MIDRIRLNLLAGSKYLPVPVPPAIIQAIKSIQVTVASGQRSGFQIVLATSRTSPITTTMIPAGLLDPGVRVVLVAGVNGLPHVLMDGIITRQEAGFSNEIGQSAVTLTGEDLTVLMDLERKQGVIFPPLNAVGQVLWLLKNYLPYGVLPVPVPELFPDVPIPTDRIKSQDGTDYEFIQKLAKDNGYVFYLDPGPAPGMSKAYWGPEIRVGVPQPALNIDMDAMTNVDSLTFSFDGLQGKQVTVAVQIPATKISIPIPLPDISLLAPPLSVRPAPKLKTEPLAGAAKDNPILAVAKGLARMSESADAVTGSGQLNVLRYGRLLQPRGLVGVRGAGIGYDGLYYVKSVTHNIKPGEYTQSFSLARNGLVSITPVVPA